MTRTTLSGWGRTAPSTADYVVAADAASVATHLATAPAVLARGLGRSYGDAGQLAGGVVLDGRALGGIGPIAADGRVTVGAGVSLDELLRVSMPQGWFVPVTPGTRQVTIGGALAADVHGKNHHVDGSFARHVSTLTLVTPSGVRTCGPEEHPDLFWATCGGMGLTGVIVDATVHLRPITSDQVLVDTTRHDHLDDLMAAMVRADDTATYSVAWVDCMTTGARMGRGILTTGEHAEGGNDDRPRAPRDAALAVPFAAPPGLLNRWTIRAFNEAWFRKAPREQREAPTSLSSFFHPLDGVRDWNRLYGPRGFVQYQFAVPDAAAATVTEAIATLAHSGVPSFLAVLKRFGDGTPGPLSFPMKGWTLALDLPVGPAALATTLDRLDDLVVTAGGRVYLAKDSRLDPATFAAMYPRLEDFRTVKATVDPHGVLTSDLARRLELC